jgi:hypothetical protein
MPCSKYLLKISIALYQLRSVTNILPFDALKSLYFALIHSQLTYAEEIWGCAPTKVINELFTQ